MSIWGIGIIMGVGRVGGRDRKMLGGVFFCLWGTNYKTSYFAQTEAQLHYSSTGKRHGFIRVQELLGHKSSKTTEIDAYVSMKSL